MNKENTDILSDLARLYKRAGLLFVILAVAMVCLRMSGAIAWGWQWVVSPLWLPLVIFVGLHALRYIFESAGRYDDDF